MTRRRVDVAALDDEFIDGGDALVFPAFEDRVNQIRGPVIIDGDVRIDDEQFLNSPLRLPFETNLQIPDGKLGRPAPRAARRRSATSTRRTSTPSTASGPASTRG